MFNNGSDVDANEATDRWEPRRGEPETPWPTPPIPTAMLRGARNRCPACAGSRVFRGWLAVEAECPNCTAPLGQTRSDDAPPYFVILLTGHLVVPLMVWMQHAASPPAWVLALIFLPMTAALALILLRPVKGATVGLTLRLGLFRDHETADEN